VISGKQAIIDQAIVSGSNFLVVLFAARFLETDEVAKYAYAFGFYMLLFMLANAWIYQNVMALGTEVNKAVLAQFSKMNIIVVLLMLPVIAFVYAVVVAFNASWIELTVIVTFIAAIQIIDCERRLLYFFQQGFISPLVVSAAGFGLRIVALLVIQPSSFVTFMTVLIVFSLPALLISLRRLLYPSDNKQVQFMQTQIKHGKWMSWNIPVNWAWGQSPVFLVGQVLGLKAAGIYAAVRSIANMANVLMEMIPTFFASRLSKLFDAENMGQYYTYLRQVMSIGLIAWLLSFMILWFYNREIIVLFLGVEYEPHAGLLLLFWLFNLCLFITRVQFLHLRFIEKTFVAPIAHSLGVLLLLTVFYTLQQSGVMAMAWAMVAGGVAIIATQLWFAMRKAT